MVVKQMSLKYLREVLNWAAEEGWNPGVDDAEAFFAADTSGYLMAVEGDKIVAGLSVVKFNDAQAFLGLYICHPDYRGRGVALELWNAGMQQLDGFTVGLDGVVEQQSNYKKSGFEFAYRNIRYCGTPKFPDRQSPGSAPGSSFLPHCRSIKNSDIVAMTELDSSVHGFNRSSFLDHWLTDTTNRKSLICADHEEIVGAGTIRRCQQGFKIGPLIANNIDIAQHLLRSLTSLVSAEEITLDVPEPNTPAVDLATTIGLTPSFETARMYRGKPPDYKLQKLFGVTTFELG